MTSQIRGKTNDPITFNDHIHNFHPLKGEHCLYVSNEKLRQTMSDLTVERGVCV